MNRFLKVAVSIAGGLFAVIVMVFVGQMIASETAEVVVLHTQNPAGGTETTRLWVVDLDGTAYLREGGGDSGWFQRLTQSPDVMVERGGAPVAYLAAPRRDLARQINKLMKEKIRLAG